MRKLRLATLVLIALMPSWLKRPVLRWLLGFKIGKGVTIGITILDCDSMVIGDGVKIGHFNAFFRVKDCRVGAHTRIGFGNIFRGGEMISIGPYCDILRFNEINAIPEPDLVNHAEPHFMLGAGSVIAASHKIDFTGGVSFGKRVVVGGRFSSVWTHNRQIAKPVSVGDCTYIGSDVKISPGVRIPEKCIVGMGSVVAKSLSGSHMLFGGVPAKAIKALDEEGLFLVENKTRADLPDTI
jgi:acetyltransferase-like isoleucine patch superfamily enzyme